MLQRARADLSGERQRCEQVLLEIARFEAEKTNMKQQISGLAAPLRFTLFRF
jgi:hypothetical protein